MLSIIVGLQKLKKRKPHSSPPKLIFFLKDHFNFNVVPFLSTSQSTNIEGKPNTALQYGAAGHPPPHCPESNV